MSRELTETEQRILARYDRLIQERYAAQKVHVDALYTGPGGAYEVGYGACPRRGDPRLYYPDLECAMPEEVTRWVEACRIWDDGDVHPEGPMKPGGYCTADESFGIGGYVWAVPAAYWEDDDAASSDN